MVVQPIRTIRRTVYQILRNEWGAICEEGNMPETTFKWLNEGDIGNRERYFLFIFLRNNDTSYEACEELLRSCSRSPEKAKIHCQQMEKQWKAGYMNKASFYSVHMQMMWDRPGFNRQTTERRRTLAEGLGEEVKDHQDREIATDELIESALEELEQGARAKRRRKLDDDELLEIASRFGLE